MKCICTIRAYYNEKIVRPGDIIEIDSENIPSWCKAISDKEKKDEIQNDNGKQKDDILEELEILKTQALEKNITIDTENKSPEEQIEELKKLLNVGKNSNKLDKNSKGNK